MKNEPLIVACLSSATACEACLNAMLGTESGNDCPRCCRECIDICLLTAQALARESAYAGEITVLCAKICAWCGEQCGAHEHDHCQTCAKACLACADLCREFVGT